MNSIEKNNTTRRYKSTVSNRKARRGSERTKEGVNSADTYSFLMIKFVLHAYSYPLSSLIYLFLEIKYRDKKMGKEEGTWKNY